MTEDVAVVARCAPCAEHRPNHRAPALALATWSTQRGRWALRTLRRQWNYTAAAQLVEDEQRREQEQSLRDRYGVTTNQRGRRPPGDVGRPLTAEEQAERKRVQAMRADPEWPESSTGRPWLDLPLDVIGSDAPADERARVLSEASRNGRVFTGWPDGRGVELRCEDCGHRPRMKKATIYGMAAVAREHGRDEIFI